MNRPTWKSQPERGSAFLIRFIAWLARSAGRTPARLLLPPISLYFLLFSKRARSASKLYLNRVFGKRVGLGHVYRHYHTFSATILDRVFFLTDNFDKFEIHFSGVEALTDHIKQGRGCILLGSHIGSFEVARSLALMRGEIPLKVLMDEENSRRIGAIIASINPGMAKSVISLGNPGSMLEAKTWLDSGGVVGILGDRVVRGEKTALVKLLGDSANLATGPIQLALATRAPVITFCGLYMGGNNYEIQFSPLYDNDHEVSAGQRGEAVQDFAERYARHMEIWCRRAPYNWFNFYDFWDDWKDEKKRLSK